jgi:hypothetical protein
MIYWIILTKSEGESSLILAHLNFAQLLLDLDADLNPQGGKTDGQQLPRVL